MYISGERALMNTLMRIVLDPSKALPDSLCTNLKNNAKSCLLNSDCRSHSFAARAQGTHMSWITIILVIYTIYITSTNAIDLNGKSFSNMDKVNEKIYCARFGEGSSLTIRKIIKT